MCVAASTDCFSSARVPTTCLHGKWNTGKIDKIFLNDFQVGCQLWDHLWNVSLHFRKYFPLLGGGRLVFQSRSICQDTSFPRNASHLVSCRKQPQRNLWEVRHQPTLSHPPRHSPSLVCTFRVAAGREDGVWRSEDVRQVTREAFHLLKEKENSKWKTSLPNP